jgi:hypothetical protein
LLQYISGMNISIFDDIIYIEMKLEYFEIDRVIEELSRNYAAPCTTTWFKVSDNKRPSIEEYRKKVIEFMKHFEHTLSNYYPDNTRKAQLTDYAKRGLQKGNLHENKVI